MSKKSKLHDSNSCNQYHETDSFELAHHQGRREFCKSVTALAIGAMASPLFASSAYGDARHRDEMWHSVRSSNAKMATILHTADIHGQLLTHDEFFIEDGQVIYKKRGGLAVLKTMVNKLRSENPDNTLLIDGGDCFQGSGVAALSQGKALVPLMNNIGYDLVLPGNWEVVYKKEMMMNDLDGYNAVKICANMFHEIGNGGKGDLIFAPYWTKNIAGIKIGFIGYTDSNIPKRQPPAFSKGIHFTKPVDDVARYITILKEQEQCAMIFLVTHLGLAQQVDLANKPQVQGVDYILGADTHERVRKPIEGKYARVTEPGAFGSFIARLDLVIENGQVKDKNYELLDVDPRKYKADPEMSALIERERTPYKAELDKVIGSSKLPLVRYYVLETPMDNMITDALMWKFKPDIAISNGFRFCPPLFPDRKTRQALITMDYLWSMVPINAEIKSGVVGGKQLWDWLEKELHNVFAKNPAERLGGWVVRMQGMHINFTMNNEFGKRLNWVKINNEPIDLSRSYLVATCEREGDPDDTLCRLGNVINPTYLNVDMHQTLIEYLKVHSPIAPRMEGRVTATDAPQNLLSQLESYGYTFF
ncbi:MAG: bifunctional metallophosphatase/5'-nucleotidase [Bacteroidota bacterium]